MKTRTLAIALSATLLLSAVPTSGNVEASTLIQRCQAGDGTVTYTDRPCAGTGQQAIPMSAELMNRIASETAAEARQQGVPAELADLGPFPDAETSLAPVTAATAAPARRPVSAGCAANPQQLVGDLRASLAMGDVNRVAESYAWMGLSNSEGQRVMDRLQGLTQRPVVNAQYYAATFAAMPSSATIWDDASGTWVEVANTPRTAAPAGDGMLQLTQAVGGSQHTVDFKVQQYNGCWFVKF